MSLILRLDEYEMNFSDFCYSRRHGMEEDPLKSWAQQSLRRLATSAHDYKHRLEVTLATAGKLSLLMCMNVTKGRKTRKEIGLTKLGPLDVVQIWNSLVSKDANFPC